MYDLKRVCHSARKENLKSDLIQCVVKQEVNMEVALLISKRYLIVFSLFWGWKEAKKE